MRIILAALLVSVVVACSSARGNRAPTASTATSTATGAGGSREAVDMFMAAIRGEDLQAVASVWGSKDGPARDLMSRDDLDRRILTMQCYLKHDRFRIIGNPRTKLDTVFYRVELTKGNMTGQTDVVTIPGAASRWYVGHIDLQPMARFCSTGSAMPVDVSGSVAAARPD